jgi:hypothetical protein
VLTEILRPPVAYKIESSTPVYGINGSGAITGHGDISNQFTWWALYTLLRASI